MAARRRCSPWPGRSGAVERAGGSVEATPSSYGPNAPKSKRNEAETSKVRRGGVLRRGRKNSGERFTACLAVSHLGRACAEAYRGEDQCSGELG